MTSWTQPPPPAAPGLLHSLHSWQFCAWQPSCHWLKNTRACSSARRRRTRQLSPLEPVLDPHCGCLGDAPGRHGARFCGGQKFYGRHSFQWSIHDTISIGLITHYIIQKCEAISASRLGSLFNKQFFTVLLGAGTLCAVEKEIVQDILWLPNLTG
jgi:hypothetical protein